jgi:glucan phosphorylase
MILGFVSAGMMIPELGPIGTALNRGGLEDLNGHVIEGLTKKGITVIPVTYGYPINWKTGEAINYHLSPARFLFDLTVDIHHKSRTIPVFGIARAGTMVYLLNDLEAGVLYPGDIGKKLEQTAFLGRAAAAIFKRIGIPDIVWAQEYMAGATLFPTMKDDPAFEHTKYVFTVHTPSRAAMDVLPADWYDGLAIDRKYWNYYVSNDAIDPTLGCLHLADKASAVSEEHGEVSRAMFPGIPIEGIMNGTSRDLFLSPHLVDFPDPNDRQLHMTHQADKREWIDLVENKIGRSPNPDEPLIGAVRRFDGYKNQYPMLKDYINVICADRGEMVGEFRGLGANVVIGGVSHEDNAVCKKWMEEFTAWMDDPQLKGRFFYIADYNSTLRMKAAAGSDLWLVCPWPLWEACGTSDFVAKINGNVNVATRSGGIKEHGSEFDPETGEGDTLFIEPYNSRTMFSKLKTACEAFYLDRDTGNGPWSRMRMNNFNGGKLLDVTLMIERYQKRIFEPLMESVLQSA